jgi:hypothetical protein
MLDAVQGRDTLFRDTIFKGRFVQGAPHSRIFGGGHINPASLKVASFSIKIKIKLSLTLFTGDKISNTHSRIVKMV